MSSMGGSRGSGVGSWQSAVGRWQLAAWGLRGEMRRLLQQISPSPRPLPRGERELQVVLLLLLLFLLRLLPAEDGGGERILGVLLDGGLDDADHDFGVFVDPLAFHFRARTVGQARFHFDRPQITLLGHPYHAVVGRFAFHCGLLLASASASASASAASAAPFAGVLLFAVFRGDE